MKNQAFRLAPIHWALTFALSATLVFTLLLVPGGAKAQVTEDDQMPPAEPTPTSEPAVLEQGRQLSPAQANSWEDASPIKSRFPMLRCGDWGSSRPYTVMREGSYEDVRRPEVMNFGFQKAVTKHDIVDPIKLWRRTLLVAQLGGGCVGRGADRGGAAAAARFIGFNCLWGDNHCVINPLRRKTVISVEVGRVNPNIAPGLIDRDQRLGNLTLHCINADNSDECPGWIYGALPYAADDPDNPVLN